MTIKWILLINAVIVPVPSMGEELVRQGPSNETDERDLRLGRLMMLQQAELANNIERMNNTAEKLNLAMRESTKMLGKLDRLEDEMEVRARERQAELEDKLAALHELGNEQLFNQTEAARALEARAQAEQQTKNITIRAFAMHNNMTSYAENVNKTKTGLKKQVEQLRARRDGLREEVQVLSKHKKRLNRGLGTFDLYNVRHNFLAWSVATACIFACTVFTVAMSKTLGVINAVLLAGVIMLPYVAGHELVANDCAHMTQIKAYKNLQAGDCGDNVAIEQNKIAFTMVQKIRYEDMEGWFCEYRTSSFFQHCGMFGHESPVAAPHIEIFRLVSAAECRAWVKGAALIEGQMVQLEHDTEVVAWSTPAGALIRHGTSVTCEGEKVRVNGVLTAGTLHMLQHRMKWSKVRMQKDGDKVRDVTNRVVVDCQARFGECPRPEGTYIWDGPEQSCEMRRMRRVKGFRRTIDGKEVVVSMADKVYMQLGESITLCENIQAYRTLYNDVFIVMDDEDLTGMEEAKGKQVAISTYIDSRDDYISYLIDVAREEMETLAQHSDCHAEARQGARQNVILREGRDRFSIIKGEIEYYFYCKEVRVTTRESEICHEDLKIDYDGAPKFLNEARLVVDHSPAVQCNRILPRGYKVEGTGDWITQVPHTIVMKEPSGNHNIGIWSMDRHGHHQNLAGDVGAYSVKELEESWQEMQYPAFRKLAATRLATTLCHRTETGKCPEGGLALRDLINDEPLHNMMKSVWSTLYEDVLLFGTISAAILGLYVVFRILATMITYVTNLLFLIPVHGLSLATMRNARTSMIARTAYSRALDRTIFTFKKEGQDGEGGDEEMGMREDNAPVGQREQE